MGEGSTMPTDPQHTPTFVQPSPPPQKTLKPRKPKRKDTQTPQLSDPTNIVADEVVHKELGDRLVRPATTASSLEVVVLGAKKPWGIQLLKLGLRMYLHNPMIHCSQEVLDLEQIKTTKQNEITSLKRRVEKLEHKKRSRTHGLKRLYKVGLTIRVESSGDEEILGEDASKQGRRINDIDEDEEITLVSVQDDADAEMFDMALKSVKPKVKRDVIEEPSVPVSAVIASTKVSAATTTTATIPTPRKRIKLSKKEQLKSDEEEAKRLQVEFDEEERLAKEKDEANIALTEEWDDIQAKIEADHELAQRLQAEEQEEFSVEEKAKLFQQLLEQRSKNFAAKSVEEKRNKPPTQAQQRKIMCTYLKNVEGKKLKDLKNKSFDSIQKMFDKAFKRVNTFVDFRTNLVEGSSKIEGEELEQESTKKQKVDEDKDTSELQSLMEVILDKEEVTNDAIPLAVKSPKIVDWKIHKEGKKSYYQIIRADGKFKAYMFFIQMLKSFDREDLEDLYKLVKARYGSTRLVENMDYLLWNDMKIMFEPHVEDEVWKLQHNIGSIGRYGYQQTSGRKLAILVGMEAVWLLWSTFLDDAVYADIHVGRKELPYNHL
ncbi:hypothetical protein Tco_0291779 [Tanacetum coccineum]